MKKPFVVVPRHTALAMKKDPRTQDAVQAIANAAIELLAQRGQTPITTDEAIAAILSVQKAVLRETPEWYALNRALHAIWKLADKKRSLRG